MKILSISADMSDGSVSGKNIRFMKLIKYSARVAPNIRYCIYAPCTEKANTIKYENMKIFCIKSKAFDFAIRHFRKASNILYKVIWEIITYPGTTDYLWIRGAINKIKSDSLRYDVIFLQIPSYFNVVYGSILNQRLKIPIVYDLRDDFSFYSNQDIVKKILSEYLETLMMKKGTKIVCVTHASIKKLKRKYPQYSSKLEFIPNGYDVEDIAEPEKMQINEPNNKSIVYTGSLDSRRLKICKSFLIILRELFISQKVVNFEIVFFTENSRKLLKLVKQLELEEFVSIRAPIYEKQEYHRMLMNAGLLLSLNYNTPHCIPGKLYEYLAINGSVLHLDNFDVASEITSLYSNATTITIDNIDKIKEYMIQHYARKYSRTNLNNDSLAESSNPYSRLNIAREYTKLFMKYDQLWK
jgi:glycosyltransferase involved in cell wall biosynthesis